MQKAIDVAQIHVTFKFNTKGYLFLKYQPFTIKMKKYPYRFRIDFLI